MTPSVLLDVDDLEVNFAGRRTALKRANSTRAVDGVSFHLERGEVLGVVGESGSGKSTVGNAILGLVRPTAGSIRYDGRDITSTARRDRRRLAGEIQVVFQDPYSSLNPVRTIGSSLTEPLIASRGLSAADARRRTDEMLARVGLPSDTAARYPAHFSGGQRQRIAIARALVMEPRLIVCDEPTSALDLSVQAQILNLLVSLRRDFGLGYLFISHDIEVIRHVADRVIVMRRGKIVEEGSVHQVMDDPKESYTRALIDAVPQVGVSTDVE